jgi:hypothetical protein
MSSRRISIALVVATQTGNTQVTNKFGTGTNSRTKPTTSPTNTSQRGNASERRPTVVVDTMNTASSRVVTSDAIVSPPA